MSPLSSYYASERARASPRRPLVSPTSMQQYEQARPVFVLPLLLSLGSKCKRQEKTWTTATNASNNDVGFALAEFQPEASRLLCVMRTIKRLQPARKVQSQQTRVKNYRASAALVSAQHAIYGTGTAYTTLYATLEMECCMSQPLWPSPSKNVAEPPNVSPRDTRRFVSPFASLRLEYMVQGSRGRFSLE